jgi:hypothetical protein
LKVSIANYKNVNKTADVYDYKTGLVSLKSTALANMTEQRDKTKEDDINILATYNKSLGQHDIGVLRGFQYLTNLYNTLSAYRQGNNLKPSSFWQVSAAYARLKNVHLGYSLPGQLLKNKSISSVRFFASGINLFTMSKMPLGMDPESPETVQNSTPLLSTYTVGAEVKF